MAVTGVRSPQRDCKLSALCAGIPYGRSPSQRLREHSAAVIFVRVQHYAGMPGTSESMDGQAH